MADTRGTRIGHYILLGLVILLGVGIRYNGIHWPRLHSDEHTIALWIDGTLENSYVRERVYPGGFFTLIRPVHKLARLVHAGLNRWEFYTGKTSDPGTPEVDTLMLARHFNIILGALTCLLLYGITRRVTASGTAGLLAALLLAVSQYHVEHCHYAESDVAMLTMLVVSLWLWWEFGRSERAGWFVAACLATGFAVGTKFTLVALVPIALIYCTLPLWTSRAWRAWRRCLLLLPLALILMWVGLAWAYPGASRVEWFIAGLRGQGARVYAEGVRNLGLAHGDSAIRFRLHARQLVEYARSLGAVWLLLSFIGLPCLLGKRHARAFPVLLLFPLLYVVHFIFVSPWVRSQEFMVLLPSLAVLAALGAVTVATGARRPKVARILRPAAACLALTAVVLAARNGLSVGSVFGWQDMRVSAHEWLTSHAPADRSVGFELYTAPAHEGTFAVAHGLRKAERHGLASIQALQCDYVLRNDIMHGRGVIDPRTNRRFPQFEANLRGVRVASEVLCRWGPAHPALPAPTFCGMDLELIAPRRFPTELELDISLPQPMALSTQRSATFHPIGHQLGAAKGLLIDRLRTVVAIGGPLAGDEPVYIVLNTLEREAKVDIRGFGRRETVDLEPYDVRVVPLVRPAWLPAAGKYERVTVRAISGKHVLFLPCILRVAFSLEEAVKLCTYLGRPDRAWEIPAVHAGDGTGLYLAAVACGRWDIAAELRPAAERTWRDIGNALQTDASSVRINGVSGFYYNEFARVRSTLPGRISASQLRNILWSPRMFPDVHGRFSAVLPLTVDTGPMSGRLDLEVFAGSAASNQALQLVSLATDQAIPVSGTEARGAFHPVTIPLPASVLRYPHQVAVHASEPANVSYRELEFRWTLRESLLACFEQYALALVTHALHEQRVRQAQAVLDTITPLVPRSPALRRLTLAALQHDGSERKTDARREAARRLLEVAPSNFDAIKLLADEDPVMKTRADELAANIEEPVLFGQRVALVAVRLDEQHSRISCVFEAIADRVPPFRATLSRLERGKWRERDRIRVARDPMLSRGERVGVVFESAFAEGEVAGLDCLALGIESDVEWSAGTWDPASQQGPVLLSRYGTNRGHIIGMLSRP